MALNTGASESSVLRGRVITWRTGVSGPKPAASTRLHRSRSVTIPGGSSATNTDPMSASRIVRAASATVATGSIKTGVRFTRYFTGKPRLFSG